VTQARRLCDRLSMNASPQRSSLLDVTLEDLFTAFALAGMLSARIDDRDPDIDRLADMAVDIGRVTATKSRRRRTRNRGTARKGD
jgi:hypothetical protein